MRILFIGAEGTVGRAAAPADPLRSPRRTSEYRILGAMNRSRRRRVAWTCSMQ